MIYMELAEQGIPQAQLNAAILLDKYDIFDTERTLLGQILSQDNTSVVTNETIKFNLNKHLAFKYFFLAALSRETEAEANLKLGDYFYYG